MTPQNAESTDTPLQTAPPEDWKDLLVRWDRLRSTSWLRFFGTFKVEQVASAAIILSLVAVGLFMMIASRDMRMVVQIVFLAIALPTLLFSTTRLQRLTAVEQEILAALASVEDTQAIGPMLKALDTAGSEAARLVLMQVLAGMLPRLTEADRDLLTPGQRSILCDALVTPSQITHPCPEFVAAALDALGVIGDQNALPLLARTIVRDAPTQGEQAARDHARAAHRCLMQRLHFGTVEDIPHWVSQLPIYSESTLFRLPPGVSHDESLIAVFALTRLLPQIEPTQGALLSRADRSRIVDATALLRYLLIRGGEAAGGAQPSRLGADFKIAVIEALRMVGTGLDAGHIRHWAYAEAPSEADRHARDLARDAMPILEARREKEQAGQTLLRGASAPPSAPDQLLRPATPYATNNAAAGELLRPHAAPLPETETTKTNADFSSGQKEAAYRYNAPTSSQPENAHVVHIGSAPQNLDTSSS